MGAGDSNSVVRAVSEASAENVSAPTKRNASAVRTGATYPPASTSRRQTSTALYAAMPPLTPSTTRRPCRTVDGGAVIRATRALGSGLGGLDRLVGELDVGCDDLIQLVGQRARLDLAHLDLLERDRQRLARDGVDLRRDDLAEALAELVVVVVDLARPHRGQRDERELRIDALEQALHARGHERGAALGHSR